MKATRWTQTSDAQGTYTIIWISIVLLPWYNIVISPLSRKLLYCNTTKSNRGRMSQNQRVRCQDIPTPVQEAHTP